MYKVIVDGKCVKDEALRQFIMPSYNGEVGNIMVGMSKAEHVELRFTNKWTDIQIAEFRKENYIS